MNDRSIPETSYGDDSPDDLGGSPRKPSSTVGTGSGIAIGCVVVVLVLIVIAIVLREFTPIW